MRRIALISVAILIGGLALLATLGAGPPDDFPGGDSAVIALGKAFDVDGRAVEGFAIIHYRKGFGKPPGTPGGGGGNGGGNGNGGGKDKGGSDCFAYTGGGKGVPWKTVEPWLVNATTSQPLTEAFVLGNLGENIDKWEDAADGTLDGKSVDILGGGSATTDALVADGLNPGDSPDGLNEVYFDEIAEPGAIAITIVWGIFSGPPPGRELVEWDQVYDDVDYTWSDSGAAGDMDFENIAAHEIGHALGMGHPADDCTEETMYRFAAAGETKKQDLEAGDIAGVDKLY